MINTNLGRISLADHIAILNLHGKHELKRVDGKARPTLEMLEDIVKIAAKSTRKRVTFAQAWQLWRCCLAIQLVAYETGDTRSEVAFWYGVDTFKMSDREVATLKTNLQRVKAQKQIADGNYNPTDYQLVYSLFLVAYGDEDRALKARAQSIEALMERRKR